MDNGLFMLPVPEEATIVDSIDDLVVVVLAKQAEAVDAWFAQGFSKDRDT